MSLFFPSLPFWSWIGLFSSAYFIGMAKGGIKGTALLVIPIMAIIFGGKVSSGIVLPMLLLPTYLPLDIIRDIQNGRRCGNCYPWHY